jgi:uncharacterized protein (TIGR00251 family)
MIQTSAHGITIDVRVIPRAARPGVAGTRGDALLVRLQAPPVDGAANTELIGIVARVLGVSRGAVSIIAGERSRQKRLLITGIDRTTAETRLASSGTS